MRAMFCLATSAIVLAVLLLSPRMCHAQAAASAGAGGAAASVAAPAPVVVAPPIVQQVAVPFAVNSGCGVGASVIGSNAFIGSSFVGRRAVGGGAGVAVAVNGGGGRHRGIRGGTRVRVRTR